MPPLIRQPPDPNLHWFKQARLGMFVHFGPYAVLARGEQVLRNENLPRLEYEKMAGQFNPRKFDADQWIDAAETMGARYITITAKHLDGFCMFDSRLTDYKITNTPFGRDLIGELAEACHQRGMRLCLYYSRADWHHRNFVHDPEVRYSLTGPLPEQKPDWPAYLEYLKGQLQELCANYGKISGIWFDAYGPSFPGDPSPSAIYNMIKKLQPEAAINERNGYGDYFTPERSLPGDLGDYLYECCQALGMEWGYIKDCPLYSLDYLIQSVAHCVGHGGNYLLNIGPKADGSLPADRLELLRLVGRWVKANAAAIYGADPFPLEAYPDQTRLGRYYAAELCATRRKNDLNVFLLAWPKMSRFLMAGCFTRPVKAELRGSRKPLAVTVGPEGLLIDGLPCRPPQPGCNVVTLTFKRPPPAPAGEKPAPPVVGVGGSKLALRPETAVVAGRGKKGNLIRIVSECENTGLAAAATYNLFENWTRPEQSAAWRLACARPGRYKVAVVLRCNPAWAGSQYRIRAAGQTLRGVVAATSPIRDAGRIPLTPGRVPSPLTKYRFQAQIPGVLRLPAGPVTLKLQPDNIAEIDRFFAEVREVRLSKM